MIDLHSYDHIIYGYSGGKDSLAGVLDLIERGVDLSRLELWHQHIDGEPGSLGLMDWPITEGYVRATGEALGLKTLFQWREGGFLREMTRDNAPTGDVLFERDGETVRLGSAQHRLGTRMKFPQVSADLSVRWCSSYLKIDVASRAINNDPRFLGKRTLYCTGERRQESSARAKYKAFEPHRCHVQKRHVDHYRNVIDLGESEVWEIIRRNRVRPHPAYYLGFGRVSCMKCIFGDPDQWRTVRELDPDGFVQIAGYEASFGKTIRHKESVVQLADRGESTIPTDESGVFYRSLAMGRNYPADLVFYPSVDAWEMPTGAFRHCGGPT